MKIKKSNIYELFKEKNSINPRFIIPIYQRPYKWDIENCRILIEDLIEVGKKEGNSTHFTGSLLIEPLKKTGSFNDIDVIDGQQRIITFMLLIKAALLLADELGLHNDDVLDLTSLIFLDSQNFVKKIIPGESDRPELNLLLGVPNFDRYPGNKDTNMYRNFEMMYLLLKELDSTNIVELVKRGLERMSIVLLEIEKSLDDAQEIFERMNSTGKPLSNADLIRNYLLMGTTEDVRESRYEYWKIIEDRLCTSKESKDNEKNLEKFFFDFTRMKKGTTVDVSKIYYAFKDYVENEFEPGVEDVEEKKNKLLKEELNKFNIYYQDFIGEDKDKNSDSFQHQLYELRLMKHTTPNPFLLRVYDDYKSKGIPDSFTFAKIVNLINTYIVRRALSKVPTSSLSGLFSTLYKNVFEFSNKYDYRSNGNAYYSAIYTYLTRASGRDAMPDDISVKRLGIDTKVFGNDIALALLQAIEFGRFDHTFKREITNKVIDPTIEHIMPQNIDNSKEWKDMLAFNDSTKAKSIHAIYVNTIGNLSLSKRGKNASMSNTSYEDKKDKLREYSSSDSFPILNEFIDKYPVFDEKTIKDRGNSLLEKIIKQYPLDNKVNLDDYKFGDKNYYTVKNIENVDANFFKSINLVECNFLEGNKRCEDFSGLLKQIIIELYNHNKIGFIDTVNNPSSKIQSWDKLKIAIGNKPSDDAYVNVIDNVYLYKKCFGNNVISYLIELIRECGEEPCKLEITVLKPDIKSTFNLLDSFGQYDFISENILSPLSENGELFFYKDLINKKRSSWLKFATPKLLSLVPDDNESHQYERIVTHHQGMLYFKASKNNQSPCVGFLIHSRKKDSELYRKFLPYSLNDDSYLALFEVPFEWNLEDDLSLINERFKNVVKSIEEKVESVIKG